MEKGWNAAGLLRDLLKQRREQGLDWTQEWLARATGIQRATINGYVTENEKRRHGLGMTNARKIADVLEVSVLELGAPETESDARGQTLLDRLGQLETDLAESVEGNAELARQLRSLRGRVARLEKRQAPGRGAAEG